LPQRREPKGIHAEGSNRTLRSKQFGFAGNSPFETAWVDALADQLKDYVNDALPAFLVFAGLKPGGVPCLEINHQHCLRPSQA
ncbi:hypothetical protein PMAYCL1PPCAC_15011, partial [Pristionchus mayeri]